MSTEELKIHYERILQEVLEQGNLDAMEKYFAPNWVMHRPWGSEDFGACKKGWARLGANFRTVRFTVDDFLVVGDMIVARYTMRGTSATGKPVEFWGIEIDRLENGMIVETWSAYDRLGMTQQLGTIPSPSS
jgi:ketosteroid isomerase-like protein